MFLTAEQIEELTGYKKPSLQRRWLLANGYRFDVRADGRPALLRAQVEARQHVTARVTSRTEPDWSALE